MSNTDQELSSPQDFPNWVEWARKNPSGKPKISAQRLLDEWHIRMFCESSGLEPQPKPKEAAP